MQVCPSREQPIHHLETIVAHGHLKWRVTAVIAAVDIRPITDEQFRACNSTALSDNVHRAIMLKRGDA